MNDVKELQRHESPGGRPQPLLSHNGTLWVGAWDTDRIYAVEPKQWRVTAEYPAPGRPYGIAAIGDELRIVVAMDDDDRYIFRFDPAKGFDRGSKRPLPDVTGSFLASDGQTLYMTQLGKRRMVVLDDDAAIVREYPLATRCLGISFGPAGAFFLITADDEFENLKLATADLRSAELRSTAIAGLDEGARGLTFDGNAWWTSYREAGKVVTFNA